MKVRNIIAALLSAVTVASLASCGNSTDNGTSTGTGSTAAPSGTPATEYSIGICNYVDDASLNQIVDNIKTRLGEIGTEKNVSFNIAYDNCNADSNLMSQIISNFSADNVDLMVGVATPVAMAMQAATEESKTPVVFAAVSDPVSAQLVADINAPGANITGTSDYLNTDAIFSLMLAANPDTKKVGLLYDVGQDSSKTPIDAAKKLLASKGIEVIERTGTTVDEVTLAAKALVADKVDAVFTPTDNTIMKSELSIYEIFAEAKIPHYTGADSFALNGAFLGYGVDYANLGVETANMAAQILLEGAAPASTPVMTFDNGTATINTDICAELGYDYADVEADFTSLCSRIVTLTTAESFDDIK